MRYKTLAGIAVFFFVLFFGLFVISGQTKYWLESDFIIKSLAKAQVYQKIPSQVIDQKTIKSDLGYTGFIKILVQSLDPAELQAQTESSIKTTQNYLTQKKYDQAALIDLTKFKADFVAKWSTTAPQIYSESYDQLPACTTEQQEKFVQNNSLPIDCKHDDLTSSAISTIVANTNPTELSKNIPDQIKLDDFFNKNKTSFSQLQKDYSWLNLIFWASLLGLLGTALSLIALGTPDWRSIFRWIGLSILLGTSLLTICFSLFYFDGLNIILSHFPGMNNLVSQFVYPIISGLVEIFTSSFTQTMGICFGIGLLLVIISFFIPEREPEIIPPGFNKNI